MKRIPVFVIALLTLVLAACSGNGSGFTPGGNGQQSGDTGQAVFTVSDAAADMGAVSDIELTVNGLRVRNEAGAWVTVDIENQAFMLLDLRDRAVAELLAQAELEAGTYDRLELSISKVVVIDGEGEHEAKLPGDKLQLEGTVEVVAGATAHADFDFLADKSLHVTGNGQYVFAPVILLEARSRADVEMRSNNEVEVRGGDVSTRMELGMDVHGNVDAGLRITPDAFLSLSAEGRVVQTGGQALVSGVIRAVDTNEGTVTIETRNGAELILHLASDSAIKVDGEAKTAADLAAEVDSQINVAYNAATKAIASAAAGASAEARAEIGANLGISGVVQSVNTSEGTVTVLTDAGTEVVLKAEESSVINLGGSLVSGLLGLEGAVGSRIDAKYDGSTGAIANLEASGEGEAQASATGTLEAVSRLSGEITVVTETGAELVLSVPARANVIVDGSVATVAALATHIGSEVEVHYNAETNATTEVRAQGSVTAEATVTGTLEGVNTLSGTITVVGETGARLVLDVSAGTQVLVGGAVSSVAGLSTHIGSEVTVTYNAETKAAGSVRAEGSGNVAAEATVTGTLKAASAASSTITVTTEAGANLVLDLASSAEVLVAGSVSSMSALATHIGSEVTVTYDAETDVASKVSVEGGASGSVSSGGTLQSNSGTGTGAASGSASASSEESIAIDAESETSIKVES